MALTNSGDIVRKAAEGGYAVAAINCQGGNYDLVRAVMETAEEEHAPVIIMAYHANTAYYGIEWLPRLVSWLAESTSVPVAAHLDHGQDVETVLSAIGTGYSSVMIDFSTKPIAQNIAATQQVLAAARPRSVSVEAELGQLQRMDALPGEAASPADAASNLVDPGDVRHFLKEAPVDMLAVGIGNAHGFYKGEPDIRLDLLEQVREVADGTPLVLHGTTGIPEDTVRACIERGVAKINFGTLVRTRFLEYVRAALDDEDYKNHIWRVLQRAADSIKSEVRAIIQLTGSAGRA